MTNRDWRIPHRNEKFMVICPVGQDALRLLATAQINTSQLVTANIARQ